MKNYFLTKKIAAVLFFFMFVFFGASYAAIINITSAPYNASTASADNVAAIQAAVNAAASGDTVLVPAGTFLSGGPITLKSNMNFQIASGAILRMLPMNTFTDNAYFLYGKNLSNISITGAGVMDGQGAKWWADFNSTGVERRPPAMIYLSGCTGVTLTGIAVQDSPKFHIQILGTSSNVYASGLSITAAWPSPNTDGFDLRGNNILIENCYISGGDDVIQLGGSSDPTSNVIIRNCSFGTGHGLSIGGYTQAGVSNLLVDNCVFNGTQYGIRWKTGRDRGGINNNLTYQNITMTGIMLYPFFLTSFYPNPSSLPPTADDTQSVTSTTPYWSNITLRNITASTAASGAKSPGIMWAVTEAPMTNILLDNVKVTGPSGVNFEFHHARGVTITCTCRVDGAQPPVNVGAFDAGTIYYPACGSTNTPTATTIVTFTRTATITYTRTITATRTTTATPTGTFTPATVLTFTTTVTSTPTITRSFTGTFTPTFSATVAVTTTSTTINTMTKTQISTITYTPLLTATQVLTATVTESKTPGLTATLTGTMQFTGTVTRTASAVFTGTQTITASATQTTTAVPSITKSNTPVSTYSATPAVTFTLTSVTTFTASPTGTWTTIQTNTVTVSPTQTVSPAAGFEITAALMYPNPYMPADGGLSMQAFITGTAESIRIRIYTVAYRRVAEENFTGVFSGKSTFVIPAGKVGTLAAGIYYAVISGVSTEGKKSAAKPSELIILR